MRNLPRAILRSLTEEWAVRRCRMGEAMGIGKRRLFWILPAAMLAAAGFLLRSKHVEPAPSAPLFRDPGTFRPTKAQWANLSVQPVKEMVFRTELLTEGNLAYDEDAETQVYSPYTGRVTRIFAKLGDAVKKGQPLMAVAASERVQAQNDLLNAKNQLELAKAAEKRQHALYLAKSGAFKDWLQSQADLAAAQNNLQAARERLRILGQSGSEIDSMESASGAKSPEALVSAPISGTVIQRQVGLGQYINSASGGAASPVYTIADLSKLWLIANVRESDAAKVHVGQPVEVSISAYPGRTYKARIAWVAPAIDPVSRRLPVRAEMENPDGMLKAMMFAEFDIS
ncbi:MAG TPA: efflux RND transporter periplasmic adaptor subunit, partial [Burkholderiales bacterium]|nr:efflux RND transporter periplasmic adaptor subunit [Burkholderiales bacterium]